MFKYVYLLANKLIDISAQEIKNFSVIVVK